MKLIDMRWTAFKESYAGLSESQLTEPGVTGNWSVKDIIAHVTWWEEEALKHLPLIIKGGRPPRYSVEYGFVKRLLEHLPSTPSIQALVASI